MTIPIPPTPAPITPPNAGAVQPAGLSDKEQAMVGLNHSLLNAFHNLYLGKKLTPPAGIADLQQRLQPPVAPPPNPNVASPSVTEGQAQFPPGRALGLRGRAPGQMRNAAGLGRNLLPIVARRLLSGRG